MHNKLLWQPSMENIAGTQMFEFLELIHNKYNLADKNYNSLHKWSIEEVDHFWAEIWDYCKIKYAEPYTQVVDNAKKLPGAKWFKNSRLNFAENLLQKRDNSKAIIFKGEESVFRELSYAELYGEVRKAAAGLKKLGVQKDDRVAAFMPNMPETVIMMLATASIGAYWSSTSPDFGIKGVLDRFSQTKPKVIIAADGYFYKGKVFDSHDKLEGIIHELPCVQHVILVDYTGHISTSGIPNALKWEEVVVDTDDELHFEQLPFDHPLYIMYSSGTTGLPKSIVHSAGGTLLQHQKELRLHCNIKEGQTIFYYTTCGWMMWNWFVSALATGATLILFDGNPFYPGPDALLKMADQLNVTFFGTSAKYIAALEDVGVKPNEISKFLNLKIIASTGSALTEESFEYVYRDWKKDVQLSSIAGGTDIISCFMLGNPILPVHKNEIQCLGLGMDVDCFGDDGKPVTEGQGELVCKTAFPSMPIYFWKDQNNERYHDAYFSTYPNIWRHGDYIQISDVGGVMMFGRSDATLNPQGVRIGTAEIYRVVENMSEVEDSVVVGKKEDGDEKVVLFVRLVEGLQLNAELATKIKKYINSNCSPRHVPAIIKQVPEIPYTINGKKVELAVKKMIHGEEIKNRDTLTNPDCLNYYKDIL
jgi:acetoacetyl-CoA synthetase